MKKIFFITGLLLFSYFLSAQKISSLNPTLIVWNLNDHKVSLTNAKYGVFLEDSISLNVFFHKSFFDRIDNAKDINFEFRWYYFLSTRRSLMFVDKIEYDNSHKNGNIVKISSSQKTLQPGWWEVQILTSYDNAFLEIGDISKFQIFVKK